MEALKRLYTFFGEKGDLRVFNSEDEEPSAKLQYQRWLWDHYTLFLERLEELLVSSTDVNVQVMALRSLIGCVQLEPTLKGLGTDTFGVNTFQRIANSLVLHEKLNGLLLKTFIQEYLTAYADVQYYTVCKEVDRIVSVHPDIGLASKHQEHVYKKG